MLSRRPALLAWLFAMLLGVACLGCGGAPSAPVENATSPAERKVMLLTDTDQPAFFLGSEPDAPVIGYGSSLAKLVILGPAENGRLPVRVHGRLRVEAYVPEQLLELRVQRRGRVRGAPVYVGPNDRLSIVGPAAEPGRLRVAARPRIGGKPLGPFQGSYPIVGLAATEAPPEAEPPDVGMSYQVPPNKAIPLYEEPRGELVALLPAQPTAFTVTVVSVTGGWLAVRAGDGPYLIGYTNEPLRLLGKPSTTPRASASSMPAGKIPARIAEEAGALKRVAKGTKLRFNDQVIAVFGSEGWARVLAEYPGGIVDVFAAADDTVAVRGLVRAVELRDAPEPAPRTAAPPAEPQAPQDLSAPAPAAGATDGVPAPASPEAAAPPAP